MGKDDGTAIGVILGLLGLIAVAELLSKKRCPSCGYSNEKNNPQCAQCRGPL